MPEREISQRHRNAQFPAGLHESLGIPPPVGLIEVSREKIAAVIAQERVDANGLLPGQMVVDHLVGDWKQKALVTVTTFDSRFFAETRLPLIAAGW